MTDEERTNESRSRGAWRTWVERVIWVGVLGFVLYRLGPQLGALTGVAPDLGRAPDYTVVTLDGDTIRAAELEGRVVVVNFWATWCGPCRLEMPSLQSLHEDRADDGVVVVGLSTDAGSERPIREYVDERGITFPIARATAEQRRAFGGIAGIPTTFLIDRNGVLRHRVVGYFTPPALRAAVGRLLGEKPDSVP
ncbi:MAG: TlpA disulfide reductase family protein [Gemmatimonadota bacterium]|nr:TlpA disulfide reductase family protein [Gemmatimonadota bacterium]